MSTKIRLRAGGPRLSIRPLLATTTPNLPAGFVFAKDLNLTSSTGWEVREGQTKADGVMRAANVSFSPTGLRISGGRATAGGEVSGGEIRGNGGSGMHALPDCRYTICYFHFDTVVGGIWPAVWERGLSDSLGELDHFEKFGTTAHANMHTYAAGSVDRNAWQSGNPTFPGAAGGSHYVETVMTAGSFSVYWDGVFVQTFTQSGFDSTATPAGSTSWAGQFCTSNTGAKTWQPIFSLQWNNAYGGGIPAGVFSWHLYIDKFSLYAPA